MQLFIFVVFGIEKREHIHCVFSANWLQVDLLATLKGLWLYRLSIECFMGKQSLKPCDSGSF